MSDSGRFQIFYPPEGFCFGLIYRVRGIPFRDGYFRAMVLAQGCLWAVDCHPEIQGESAAVPWRPIDFASHQEIALEHI
jgi:hypothetical protein